MSAFNAAVLRELKAGAPRKGIFFYLASDPPVRIWLGVGAIRPGVNVLDEFEETYLGFGEITDMPALQQLCDGSSEQVEFTISGIPPTVFRNLGPHMREQNAAIVGKFIAVGWGVFDDRWQLLDSVWWEWFGFGDFLRLNHAVPEGARSPDTWDLQLIAGSWNTGRGRAGMLLWTHPHQARRALELNPLAPTDLFCEQTVNMTDTEKPWPDF
jgi:hypothetical protein